MQKFPKRIRFHADENEAILMREEKTKSSVTVGYYQYVISKTKLGREMPMELEYIEKLQRFDLLTVLIP